MTFAGGGRACLGLMFAQLEMSPYSILPADRSYFLTSPSAEVVLSTLLKSFRFTPADKKVIWRVTTVVQPTIEDAEVLSTGDKKVQLPLNLSLV